MGIIDRLKGIGRFGETIKRSLEPTQLVLDDDHATWADKAVAHLRLDWEFTRFSELIKTMVEDAAKALEPLTSEERIAELPERARTVNDIHAHEFAQKARKVLIATRFTDLYRYDEDHQAFLQAMQEFRDESARNIAALREHLGADVDAALAALQRLEDETIRFAQLLEERKFTHVKRLKEAHDDLAKLDERRAKEEELLAALHDDHAKASERVTALEGGIHDEEGRIRNDDARQALASLTAVEEELERIVGPIQLAARDAIRYCRKHPDGAPPEARQALDDLDHDAAHAIAADPDRISTALGAVAEQVATRPNTRPLAARLERAASQMEGIAEKVNKLLPEQSQLRRGIMRDVAALSAYDKRQFLSAARRDVATTAAKITFLEEDLDPGKRIEHERALKDAALALGASIPGEVPPATPEPSVQPDPKGAESELDTPDEPDSEIAKAEETLGKANELLKGKKRRKGKR